MMIKVMKYLDLVNFIRWGYNIGKTSVYRNLNRDCKYIKIVYEEMELIPNKKAPGTINIKKDDVEDVVFQINLK